MKRDIRQWPPIISLIKGLLRLGHEVDHFSYYCTPETLSDVAEKTSLNIKTISSQPYPGRQSFPVRARATWMARQGLKTFLARHHDYDLVWLGEWDYPDIVKIIRRSGIGCPIIYQLHEYNPKRFPCCQLVDQVVVPEENRAWMTYFNAKIERVPLVLPNSPLDHPRASSGQFDPTLRELNKSGKKVVLYQGHMDLKKRCLLEMIQAIALTPPQFVLGILPANLTSDIQTAILEESNRLGVSNRVVFLKSRVPPHHLKVVGQAHIGIGLYRPTSLNQIYCAPNRLYEFTGFGIPVILPNFPGISQLAARYPGVLTCDPDDPKSIANAICAMEDAKTYKIACKGAEEFFNERGEYLESLQELMKNILNESA